MSYFFKNAGRLAMSLGALLLAITLAAGSFAYSVNGLPDKFASPGNISGREPEDMGDMEVEPDGGIDDPMPDFDDSVFADDGLSVESMAYNIPGSLKAAYIVPGVDFITEKELTAEQVKAEIDAAVSSAERLGLNAVVIDTTYNTDTIYETSGSVAMYPGEDIMGHAVRAVRDGDMLAYARFDASLYADMDALERNVGEFAKENALDGILIDGYETPVPTANYSEYRRSGGSIGFDNYLLQESAEKVRAIYKAAKASAPEMAVGLLANAVWANGGDHRLGSDTAAEYRSLINGHADTKSYIEHKFVDFVAVEAFTLSTDPVAPFDVTVSWWNGIAAAADMPMYVVHAADKIGESGWPADMLEQQPAEVSHLEAYKGSIFNTVTAMAEAAENAEGEASPAASNQQPVTATPTPAAPVTPAAPISPVPVSTAPAPTPAAPEPAADDTEGSFDDYTDFGEEDADFGDAFDDGSGNTGSIIREISPTGVIMALEDDIIDISVTAKSGATVYASINGESVALEETGGGGSYAEFSGYYEVPPSDEYASGEYQYLGGLAVTAELNGREDSFDGTFLSVAGSGRIPMQVTADQARTYPADKNDNVPIPSLYPLPRGTVDYVVSGIMSYRSPKGEDFKFVELECGVRVETKDITRIDEGPGKNNRISGMAVTAQPNSRYTYVTLKTRERVAYKFAYDSSGVTVSFYNTTRVPGSKKLSSNPLFTEANWTEDGRLKLSFVKKNGFMGYKAYYDKNYNLVFRFRNPPKNIKSAKIAIDPGHGGVDRGGEGYDSRYPEKVITAAMSKTIAEELEDRGATVLLMQSANTEGPARAKAAEEWGADMLISVHCNTSGVNPNATGTEVFYFYPFSYQLAAQASARVSKSYGVDNRGAKPSYYHVTLSPQMSSVLLETGFLTNKSDYSKLLKASNHKRIAVGLADSVEAAIKAANTGVSASGSDTSESLGEDYDDYGDYGDYETTSSGGSRSDEPVEELWFDEEIVTLEVGETKTLAPVVEPEDAGDAVTFKSSSSGTVTVDAKGKIKGIKAGTATVSATAKDREDRTVRANVKIEVVDEGEGIADSGAALSRADEVYKDESELYLARGESQRLLLVNENDKQIRNADFKWKSSKSSVASVDGYGVVRGVARGSCVVTATAKGYEFEWDIEVSAAGTGSSSAKTSIDVERDVLYVERGGEQTIVWSVSSKSGGKTVTWTSSNDRLCTVDKNGVVTGVNAGKATVTGKTGNGGQVKVTVRVVNDPVDAEDLALDINELEMQKGDEDKLTFELSPEDATDSRVTWKSSNPGMVSVDKYGNIKALKAGVATITCTAKGNKNATDKCKITVY